MRRNLLSPIEIDSFFDTIRAPEDYDESVSRAARFIQAQRQAQRRLVLITSGGTTVPLERQMVRFLDNFSAGTRGSVSAEYSLLLLVPGSDAGQGGSCARAMRWSSCTGSSACGPLRATTGGSTRPSWIACSPRAPITYAVSRQAFWDARA